jgi:hypothetical protein
MHSDILNNYEINEKFKSSVFTQEFFKLGKYITRKLAVELNGGETKPDQPLLPYIDGVDGNSVYLAYSRYPHGVSPAIYITKKLIYPYRVKRTGISNNKAVIKCLSFMNAYMEKGDKTFDNIEYGAMLLLLCWFKNKPRLYLMNEPSCAGSTISLRIDSVDCYFHLVINMERFQTQS